VTTERTCRYCGATIEDYGDPQGWVDVLSGDEGGTYDYCPDSPEDYESGKKKHWPAAR
jgi:hypothetical protein